MSLRCNIDSTLMHAVQPAGPSKKRRRSVPLHLLSPESTSQAAKRIKSLLTPVTHPSRPLNFWATISKVRLSRGALREFEQRNSQIEKQASKPLFPVFNHTFVGSHLDLSRFARRGGPDLAHLRGVSSSVNLYILNLDMLTQ